MTDSYKKGKIKNVHVVFCHSLLRLLKHAVNKILKYIIKCLVLPEGSKHYF